YQSCHPLADIEECVAVGEIDDQEAAPLVPVLKGSHDLDPKGLVDVPRGQQVGFDGRKIDLSCGHCVEPANSSRAELRGKYRLAKVKTAKPSRLVPMATAVRACPRASWPPSAPASRLTMSGATPMKSRAHTEIVTARYRPRSSPGTTIVASEIAAVPTRYPDVRKQVSMTQD